MAIPPVPQRSHTWRYTDTILVFLAGLVAGILGGIVVFAATGEETFSATWLFWLVLPAQFAGTYAALWWVSRRRGRGSWELDFGFTLDPKDFWFIGVGMAVLLATGLIAQGLRIVLNLTDENPQALIDIVDEVGTGPTVFAMVTSLVILGPIAEEVTYRGLLLKTLQERTGDNPAIVISALVFAAVHLTDPSLFSLDGLPTLVALMLVGLILAIVTVRSGNLSRAIFLHGGFNLLTTITLLFGGDLGTDTADETVGLVLSIFG